MRLGNIYEKHKGLDLVYEVEMELIDEVLSPKKGLYMFLGEMDEVLYVGLTNNYHHRIVTNHKYHTGGFLYNVIHNVVKVLCLSYNGDLKAKEIELIKEYKPPFNRQYNKPFYRGDNPRYLKKKISW